MFYAVPWAAHWLHALAIGTIALMVIAVITLASLGHTGRALESSRVVKIGYAALAAAALLRVFGVMAYGPVLLAPRMDGKPG